MHYSKTNCSRSGSSRITFYTAINLIIPDVLANLGNGFLDTLYPTLTGEYATFSFGWATYGDTGLIKTMVFVFLFETIKNYIVGRHHPLNYWKKHK